MLEGLGGGRSIGTLATMEAGGGYLDWEEEGKDVDGEGQEEEVGGGGDRRNR